MADQSLLAKFESIQYRFDEVGQQITDPAVMSDMKRYVKLNQEYRRLELLVQSFKEYKNLVDNILSGKEMLAEESDPEIREMAKEEIEQSEEQLPAKEKEIKLLLVPADPEDGKNAILEIRAGTGGDEASIFAGDLFRMYTKFCESKKWKMEVTNISEGTSGGYKEIVAKVSGNGVYGILKYESGVHTAYNEYHKPRLKDVFTHPLPLLPCCPKLKNLTLTLKIVTSGKTPTVHQVPADSL